MNLLLRRFAKLASLLALVVSLPYAQVPTIGSFSPSSGPIGTTVTIAGTKFRIMASFLIMYDPSTYASVACARNSRDLTANYMKLLQ